MPRIRKKTSKRGTTHHRERIKHKVSEHRKKAKKQARKDKAAGRVRKQSKKDPGIPNAFPYKDEILAEIQQQRLEAAAEKQRRKAEKRAALAASKSGEEETQSQTSQDVEDEEGQGDIDMIGENDGHGFDGVTSLKRQPIPLPQARQRKTVADAENNEPKLPAIPVDRGPLTLREVLNKADVLVCVVDARDPEAGISEVLMKEAQEKGKDMIIVVNKADTIPRESLVEWLGHLRRTSTAIPFRVSSAFMSPYESPAKGAKGVRPMDDALGSKALWSQLESFAKKKEGDELVVGVTGVTNSGKSAMINSLFGVEVLPIYKPLSSAEAAKLPYTTMTAQEVVASIPGNENLKVRFIDTPGLDFSREEFADNGERDAARARDILLRCRGRVDRLKDPMSAVTHIVSRAETQDLMLAYNLPAFPKGDTTAFLAGIARVNSLVKTKGVLDHAGAARIVLRDWSLGKLVRYTMPARLNGGPSPVEGDEEVLAGLRMRKELRKAKDVKLVRLAAGEMDRRDVLLDQEWEEEESEESGDEGEGGEDESEDGEDDSEEEEAGESDVDEEEAPELLPPAPSPPAMKRKRTVSFAEPEKRRRGRAR